MHPIETRERALNLVRSGANDCQVARALGLPRTTVRDWRRGLHVERPKAGLHPCPRCWRPARPVIATPYDYAELLGLYLGDGCIVPAGRVERLRLSLDAKYAGIVDDAEALLRRCFPHARVGRVAADGGSTVVLSLYRGHLSCRFPQHGPGKKHERSVALEDWQRALVRLAPWAFLRGCIRSDGCVFVNRTGRYAYLSYEFFNHSQDILDAFAEACDHVGVEHRRYARRIRICRRASVEMMRRHVGLKA